MYLSQLTSYGYTLYGDLPGYFHPNALFRSMRPDIVLTKNDDIYLGKNGANLPIFLKKRTKVKNTAKHMLKRLFMIRKRMQKFWLC